MRKRRGFFRIIFGRTTMVVLMLLIQLMLLIGVYSFFAQSIFYYQGATLLLSFIVLVWIINSDNNSGFKIAWIIPVLSIPVFGSLFYLYYINQNTVKQIQRRLDKFNQTLTPIQKQTINQFSKEINGDLGEIGIANYLYNTGTYIAYTKTHADYFPIGEDMYSKLIEELNNAKEYIFIEYFIIAKGEMWESVLEILKKKVSEGVEVRVLYDGMCSFILLPYKYPKQLEKYGIQCRMFSPIVPVLSTYHNNRDHRKIVVIDGKTAFTGGINLADEYINRIVRFGHWKDTAIMLKGDAVRSMLLMFLEMWNVSTPQIEDYSKYLKLNTEEDCVQEKMHVQESADADTQGIIIPYGDGPYNREDIGKEVYIDILNRAVRYVHIMTPYLILDEEMASALKFCAKRGVETIIIMPHIPDKKYAYLLARTYYKELINAGVKIYEYTPGFVHAKQFISDDVRGAIGTFNLDYRSLYLHYECSVYMYRNPALAQMEKDYQETLAKCERITIETCNNYSKFNMAVGRVLRIFAPMM